MPSFPTRKKIRLSRSSYHQNHAFFITIDTYGRYPWFGIHKDLAENAVPLLRGIGSIRRSQLYAWCIMPHHMHLLVQDRDIVALVRLVKGKMVPMARAFEPDRRFWQRSFYDHGLRKEESLRNVSQYIWDNPVRAGIVDRPNEYPWSGSEVWSNWREF